ncbi:MAG: hypothetical protein Q4Q17_05590 [Tissierellia bacterium]|nr:hypothetical protein [Tissierellia bacterium]
MKYSKFMIILFFVLLLGLSHQLLSSRNKVVKLSVKDVDYVEIIIFQQNTMKTIQDPGALKDIVKGLNRVRGKETQKDNSVENINYINIYKKRGDRIEVVKSGLVLRVDNHWYNLSKRSSHVIDQIFKRYMQ